MTAPFAFEFKGADMGAVEKNHRFGRQGAVLGGAERQNVDARPPGHLRRAQPTGGDRVGESRAVHVQGQAMTMGDVGDGANFIDAIARAGLGQLGDADRRR